MDNLCIEEVDPSVSFLYKAMLQRDPKKRRVKPVQKHMIQVDFGGGDDSEEDSDFDMKKHKGDSGDEDSDEKAKPESDDEDSGVTDESDEDGESSGDESDHGKSHLSILNMDLDSADDEDYVPNQKKKKLPAIPNKEMLMEPLEAATPPPLLDSNDIKIVICCVCLTDVTGDDDEIVECDNCGASVHEGCYGISDFQSTASTESSASTEPWFCDACKAGATPSCELCPNFGGIFKETDTGKWVHLVCALYTPGVAFGDVDKLSPITLFEMPYARWGARECSLCEDIRFSRTGVCISCDAGMCRSYFHVTCAQREGLLSEASPEEVMDIADPFYAYCKLHADKNTSRHKRRNWLAIQSRVKRLKEKSIDDEREKARFERKLQRHCEKYTVARQKRPPSWVPTQKMVRFLSSSPSAVRNMLRKAELMGVITHVQAAPNQKQETRKKWHTAPAFSTEFITHYLERNVRIDNMKNSLKELMKQNLKLHEQEKILRQKYDQLSQSVEDLKSSNNKMRSDGEGVWQKLVEIGGKNIKLPDLFKPKKTVKPATKNPKETPKSPPALIHQCGICKKTTNQHLLAKCDSCKLFYHLGCLDPPLTRMPKKTKLMGWQCSECADTSSEEEEVPDHVVDGPRRLRETIKEPLKFQFMEMYDYKKKEKKKPRGIKKKKMPKIENTGNESVETETKTPTSVKKRKIVAPARTKKPVVIAKKKEVAEEVVECVVCSQPGETSNTVRCDECQLCYHFTCLNPPVKKSPKRRGYSWHCEACDPTDDSEDFGGIEEDEDSKLSAPPLEGSVNSSDDDVIFIEQVDL